MNHCNNLNVNPLRFAVIKNNFYALTQLVEHGADSDEKCGNSRKPREFAEAGKREKMAKYLAQKERFWR